MDPVTDNQKKSVIPFGPQHPVLPEPIKLRLVLEDEKVIEALPAIGYAHRGIEKLAEKKDFVQNVYLMERICGICSFIHPMTYCLGIEELMNIKVPERANYLRVIWSELHRIHSHLLILGLLADAFGFENLFMQSWRVREEIMDIMEYTAGARILLSACAIGGVKKDISKDKLQRVLSDLDTFQKHYNEIVPAFVNDYTVKHRLVGVGAITKQTAFETGAVGPVLKACGVRYDLRTKGYAAYGDLAFEPVVYQDGDCYARTMVRIDETNQSVDLIRQAIAKMPDGEICAKVTGNPTGEVVMRAEQPRGEVVYFIKANGTKNLERLKVRTPTFANFASLLKMLPGSELADVPVLILSIDPCISCTDR